MLIRDNYTLKKQGLSTQNEPSNDLILYGNVRQYPDMYYAYKKFGSYFGLDTDRFFLANGCENSIKNVFLALKPTTLCWGIPTWRMLEVYCEALNMKPIMKNFSYDGYKFKEPDIYTQKCDVLYTNCGITTCFKYDFDSNKLYESKSKYNICDITYQNIEEMKKSIEILSKNDKNIIVGSFDKLIGCGLRLGFAIYPKELHHKMSLQREQYVNMLAYNWLINTDFVVEENKYVKELKAYSNIEYLTDNFFTIKGEVVSNIPHHEFDVDGYKFTRFGIPNSITEFNSIHVLLKDLNNEYNR